MIRQDARKPRELHARHLVAGLVGDEARYEQLARDREDVLERGVHPRSRVAGRVEAELERLADGPPHVLGELHLGTPGHVLRQHSERLVRVDASLSGTRDRDLALERQPGRVREQVADRRARRTCRLVEIDNAFLGGDERRERGDRLRHRRETNRGHDVTVRRDLAFGIHRTCRGELDRPVVDLAECLHAARY